MGGRWGAKVKPCVLLRNLPRTALPQDLRRLGAQSGDVRVDFLRTPLLQPTGRAIVSVPRETPPAWTARRLQGTTVGGRAIDASEVRRTLTQLSFDDARALLRAQYASKPPALHTALDVLTAEPERCVLLRNLPMQTTAEKLEKKLRRSYALVGESDEPVPLALDAVRPLANDPEGPRLLSELWASQRPPAPRSVLKLPALYVRHLTQACLRNRRLVPGAPPEHRRGHAPRSLVAPAPLYPAKIPRGKCRRPVRRRCRAGLLVYTSAEQGHSGFLPAPCADAACAHAGGTREPRHAGGSRARPSGMRASGCTAAPRQMCADAAR